MILKGAGKQKAGRRQGRKNKSRIEINISVVCVVENRRGSALLLEVSAEHI